ncbi:Na+/H+ antiporter NhaA [Neisseria leonii]|uniref:Na(+)/H(+) antiporter NhaA n=1 Tax=Neisseria leonii TaxID=2995413 RepID=A0A9X4ID59_9NEIS|nr:Na+/H+ antiporter NhaA [Neisseria sp. 51.81]MDD9326788.1 Na+/H+ antiporter NhaA [Neisseria sp. 51.81]
MKRKLVSFFQSEPAAGIVLMLAAALGLAAANSDAAGYYFGALGSYVAGLSVLHWVNDGLMAVFFLYVGLEVKRELLRGELDTNSKRFLPAIAALAGLAAPAGIYLLFNGSDAAAAQGWAIPAATDIAFALGVLALLGSRVPVSLKIFLTALAIMDDLAAIVIIALFYTEQLAVNYLLLAAAVLAVLFVLNKKGVTKTLPYLLLGLLLWFFFLKSGIHATLAGVLLAFTVPLRINEDTIDEPPLLVWEHALTYWVSFLIVPVFGFANAGVSFADFSTETLFSPVVLGIALGLFAGKQFGIFGIVWLLTKLRLAKLPEGATWLQLYGVALLCGIGFTMSLFISLLAFNSPALQDFSKVGVFMGSLLSGILGYAVLRLAPAKQR